MLVARFNVSNPILWLLASIYPATADPVCHLEYGQPTYTDCRDLVLALYDGWPGQVPDGRDHYFSVRGEPVPPWIDPLAINVRRYLPGFAAQG